MRSIRLTRELTALVFLAPLGGAIALHGCIPSPDTSGLPARDAGTPVNLDGSSVQPSQDAGIDSPIVPKDSSTDANDDVNTSQTGTIQGAVIDFAQVNRGLVPDAHVTALVGGTAYGPVTTDQAGRFTITDVPAGDVLLNVTKPTDTIARIAYGTTQMKVTLAAGQTVSAFPSIHEGCYVEVQTTTQATLKHLQDGVGCSSRSGAYLGVQVPPTSFLVTASGLPYQPQAGDRVRVEMIPLAYPLNGQVPDLSWATAMPGELAGSTSAQVAATIDPIGGGEIRIIDESTETALQLGAGKQLEIQLPLYRQPVQADAVFDTWSFNPASGLWKEDPQTPIGTGFTTAIVGNTTHNIYSVNVSHLTWWSVAHPRAQGTGGCIAGRVVAAGVPVANATVRAVGTSFLGATTVVTDASGNFCVETEATKGLTFSAGYADSTGGVFAGTSPTSFAGSGGNCNTPSACQPAGDVSLTSLVTSCVSGNVTFFQAPVTVPLDVEVGVTLPGNQLFQANQLNAGIRSKAYVGQITPASDGAFCIPGAANTTVYASDRTDALCAGAGESTDAGFANNGAQISVGGATGGATCGAGGCFDAGAVVYGCN